jgi:hypothetical protein
MAATKDRSLVAGFQLEQETILDSVRYEVGNGSRILFW